MTNFFIGCLVFLCIFLALIAFIVSSIWHFLFPILAAILLVQLIRAAKHFV